MVCDTSDRTDRVLLGHQLNTEMKLQISLCYVFCKYRMNFRAFSIHFSVSNTTQLCNVVLRFYMFLNNFNLNMFVICSLRISHARVSYLNVQSEYFFV